ncbi:septal ring lytic transglycosylase RlpA family protein [Pajaroellobacter abortibovis]|uniref:Probable endolytic peptidoglycan transglycosylase RlpA n=1 Tax=Pajaroellobacter abortibovis TaxID=1882918 RepID=A0A1L6MXF1_9BACT|nr:septal ring lytic transglycosylase RlpA family protein [Pajaroellobacter abortibovis]APS00197.1 hypothetical protein BCY86_05510 [Pajaroellobacter abortibovis]
MFNPFREKNTPAHFINGLRWQWIAVAVICMQGCVSHRTARWGANYSQGYMEVGLASWYGPGFAGCKTANGEVFDPRALTAAHRSAPFGTWFQVRRLDTNATVAVRINDRGPYAGRDRIIDLSKAAAAKLKMIHKGVTRVELRVIRAARK